MIYMGLRRANHAIQIEFKFICHGEEVLRLNALSKRASVGEFRVRTVGEISS